MVITVLDLYHRPFNLPTVAPDPYWSTRQKEDDLALTKRRREGDHSGCLSRDPSIPAWKVRQLLQNARDLILPIVPKDTLPPGIEKYALGRRFLVTKNGYPGLAPKEAKKRDRMAILLG